MPDRRGLFFGYFGYRRREPHGWGEYAGQPGRSARIDLVDVMAATAFAIACLDALRDNRAAAAQSCADALPAMILGGAVKPLWEVP